LFGVLAEIAELVQVGVKAGADDAGVGCESGRFVGERAFEAIADVGKLIDFIEKKTKKGAAASRRRSQKIAQDRKLRERFA